MSVSSQYEALTRGTGWATLYPRTLVEITGKDRVNLLHNLCTNDIRQLKPGDSCEAFLTNVKGKTLSYLYIHCLEEALLLETSGGQAESLLAHFDRYIIREAVELHDRSEQWRTWLVAGSQAAQTVRSWGWNLPQQPSGNVALPLAEGIATLHRLPFVGRSTLLLSGPKELASTVEPLCQRDGVPCAEEVVEIRRIEAGSPLFGVDITADNLPQEVDRNKQAISFTKGCYLGQEPIARLDALGHVNRMLVGLRLDTDRPPAAGTRLTLQEKPVARITSACHSLALQAPLALAYVRREHYAVGSELACDQMNAKVVELPLVVE